MDIQTILLFITASVNSLLSLFVLLGKRNSINIVYSLFVLFASMWAIGLAFFIMEKNLNTALYIANFYYIAAAGIPSFFLYFSLLFPNKDKKYNIYSPILVIFPLLVIIFLFIINPHFIIEEVVDKSWGKDVVINKFNYILYSLYFLIFVILSYVKLINKFFSSKDIIERDQLKFIIWGTLVGFIFGMIFDLFFPFFGNYRYIFLGPLFSFSMVASIAYSISKYRLFDMKVIATQLLTFILWTFLFVRTILSSSFQDQLINLGLLLVTIVIGIFLIRSVIKEVRQKEEIQKLAENLKRANQGQASLMHFMNHQVKGRFGNAKNIFAELLTNDYGTMPEEAKPLLEKGLDETNLGINYVQNILRGASAENGTLPIEKKPMDFRKVVEEISNKQKDYVEKKGLRFSLNIKDGDYNINGDELQLGECVKNLIDNSINYTENGSVEVYLSENNGSIKLEVKDTGFGLTFDDKLKLWKSGGRGAESLKLNTNSTGYGLAFVKGVVEAHKGHVGAESAGRGQGSTFYIELVK